MSDSTTTTTAAGAPPEQTLISLRHVTKTFKRGRDTVEVLRDLSLDIPAGDFLALMAPSGSGKSTLLNLIAGIDQPTRGDVVVGGKTLNKMRESAMARWRAANIGFVFQLYHLLDELTAEENVELPLILTGLSAKERRRRAAAALLVADVADRAKFRPPQLSGGQQQRVAIARAIVTDPAILVCDEPTGDLDRKTGDGILSLLRTLNTQYNKTIIMVTHDPRAAARARRTLFLVNGVLKEEPEA